MCRIYHNYTHHISIEKLYKNKICFVIAKINIVWQGIHVIYEMLTGRNPALLLILTIAPAIDMGTVLCRWVFIPIILFEFIRIPCKLFIVQRKYSQCQPKVVVITIHCAFHPHTHPCRTTSDTDFPCVSFLWVNARKDKSADIILHTFWSRISRDSSHSGSLLRLY